MNCKASAGQASLRASSASGMVSCGVFTSGAGMKHGRPPSPGPTAKPKHERWCAQYQGHWQGIHLTRHQKHTCFGQQRRVHVRRRDREWRAARARPNREHQRDQLAAGLDGRRPRVGPRLPHLGMQRAEEPAGWQEFSYVSRQGRAAVNTRQTLQGLYAALLLGKLASAQV